MLSLFEEFKGASLEEWREKIKSDLKGADYQEILYPLNHKTALDPALLSSTHEHEKGIASFPHSWMIVQKIDVFEPQQANKHALDALQNGADGIDFQLQKPLSAQEIQELFKDISFVHIPLNIGGIGLWDSDCLAALNQHLAVEREDEHEHFSISLNIFSKLLFTGEWILSQEEDVQFLRDALANSNCKLLLDQDIIAQSGADEVQQLACLLSQTQALAKLLGADALSRLDIKMNIGIQFLNEIGKFRAAHELLKFLYAQYEVKPNFHIWAEPNLRYESVFDEYNNLLRHCTQSMSAILGGARNVIAVPYNRCFKDANDFSLRMARNIQLLLREESYLAAYADPAAGAYLIEEISGNFEQQAFELFKEWEAEGGFLAVVSSGKLQSAIESSAQAEQAAFDQGQKVVLGVNKYPNTEEEKQGEIAFDIRPISTDDGLDCRPLRASRLAQEMELARLAEEEKALN